MRKIGNILRFQVSGTIVEQVVAIVLLVSFMGLSLTIITKQNTYPYIRTTNRANELIGEQMQLVLSEGNLLEGSSIFEGVRIEKKVNYPKDASFVNIGFKAYDVKGRNIVTRLFTVPEYSIAGLGSND